MIQRYRDLIDVDFSYRIPKLFYVRTGRPMKEYEGRDGIKYVYVPIKGGIRIPVHSILFTVLFNKRFTDKVTVHYKDGDSKNTSVKNLEYIY